MSDELVPVGRGGLLAEPLVDSWQEARPPVPALQKSPLERPLAALRRFKWLALAVTLLATAGGFVATRFLTPEFTVGASIMIATSRQGDDRTGPIRSSGFLMDDDWAQLLRSYTISDAVVRKLSLFLEPDNRARDSSVFRGFGLADQFYPGKYELVIDRTRKRWLLSSSPSGVAVDSGGVADSVGNKLVPGFKWQVPAWVFTGEGERKIAFTVAPPREIATKLIGRLGTRRQEGSNFLGLTLTDEDPHLAANILNTWLSEFVAVAADLKTRKLTEFARTLEAQVHTQKNALDSAERAYESFRVRTITEPREGAIIAAGLQETRDPVMREYFDRTIDYEDTKRDVLLLQSLLPTLSRDSIPREALLQIRSVAASSAGDPLRTALADFRAAENELANAKALYTDEHPITKAAVAKFNTLRQQKIPQYAADLLASLRTRAREDSLRLAASGQNMQKIPQRTIEEERLRRARDVVAGLYTNLQNRFAEAQLAEASATPDVRVLDQAIAPLRPEKNTKPRILMIAILGGIGAGIALAILLDRIDSKLRYPEQATEDLGLPIAGIVPRFPKQGVDRNSPEQMFQLIESFRSLRMSVMQVSNGGSISFAVSSPAPAEGKSLISANLAMSFADAGLRTILVDGDTRRGALHEMFGLSGAPGLTDYLSGQASLSDVTRPTTHAALNIIPCGVRQKRSPELLTSERLPRLVAELRSSYDVVIFDTPPLAAGIDGYSIATATGHLLVVLRIGQTARRMAAEKLQMFERLPVDIVGAVLNGIQFEGGFSYYGYDSGYEATDEAEGSEMVKLS